MPAVLLCRMRIADIPPFDDVVLPFDDDGAPRPVTVIHGGGGVGKTTLLGALATTRPGHAIAQPQSSPDSTPGVVCEWVLGHDDPERPHPLTVATPAVRVEENEQREALRRREQAWFDKLARQGGFAFLALSSSRWFSRQPIGLSAPARTVVRYDVRAPANLDDASRADLARETKQALAYADLSAALSLQRPQPGRAISLLGHAMHATVDALVSLAGYRYVGLDAISFEPLFADERGRELPFDRLPTSVRHLTAFAALPVRTLWAAYPGRDPREGEGVVAIDEIDLHQDAAVQIGLLDALRAALPHVQWIVTATSPALASARESSEVLALRRLPNEPRVELYRGAEARLH